MKKKILKVTGQSSRSGSDGRIILSSRQLVNRGRYFNQNLNKYLLLSRAELIRFSRSRSKIKVVRVQVCGGGIDFDVVKSRLSFGNHGECPRGTSMRPMSGSRLSTGRPFVRWTVSFVRR